MTLTEAQLKAYAELSNEYGGYKNPHDPDNPLCAITISTEDLCDLWIENQRLRVIEAAVKNYFEYGGYGATKVMWELIKDRLQP